MRNYVEETVEITRTTLKQITCDLCGREAKKGHWDSSIYSVNETDIEVTIKQKEGDTYPESGSGTEIIVDLCPTCFKERLVPWLNSQGASIEEKEWDY